MTKSTVETLRGVSETLLVTLYLRAIESQRPDALIKDKKAVALVKQLRDEGQYDFSRIRLLHLNEANKLVTILRSREFDRYTRDFLMRHPNALVVHIGCGFDTRFDRVDNGQVVWYDLDLPDIIELRRQLIGDEEERYHLLGYSVLDSTWLEVVSEYRQRPFLFLAEGLTMHLKETQNKALVRMLYDHFPGAELIFDAYSPIHNIVSNLQSARFGFRTHWGLWHGQEIESWGNVSPSGADIRLLDEWGFLVRTESRLTRLRWLRPIESLFRTLRIYHFKLGE
jgi:O-methyltransferase involved in polyketide biosynthesis